MSTSWDWVASLDPWRGERRGGPRHAVSGTAPRYGGRADARGRVRGRARGTSGWSRAASSGRRVAVAGPPAKRALLRAHAFAESCPRGRCGAPAGVGDPDRWPGGNQVALMQQGGG